MRPLLKRRFVCWLASVLALFALLATVLGCREQQHAAEEPALETVEVDAAPTAVITPDDDARSQRTPQVQSGLTGLMPGGFPSDLQLFLPASVVDIGERAGTPWVRLRTHAGSPQSVSAWLERNWSAAGWQRSSDGTFRQGERKAQLSVEEDENGATEYEIEFTRP